MINCLHGCHVFSCHRRRGWLPNRGLLSPETADFFYAFSTSATRSPCISERIYEPPSPRTRSALTLTPTAESTGPSYFKLHFTADAARDKFSDVIPCRNMANVEKNKRTVRCLVFRQAGTDCSSSNPVAPFNTTGISRSFEAGS